jgi:hypothetical protein
VNGSQQLRHGTDERSRHLERLRDYRLHPLLDRFGCFPINPATEGRYPTMRDRDPGKNPFPDRAPTDLQKVLLSASESLIREHAALSDRSHLCGTNWLRRAQGRNGKAAFGGKMR